MHISYYCNMAFSTAICEKNEVQPLSSGAVAQLYLQYKNSNCKAPMIEALKVAERQFYFFMSQNGFPSDTTGVEVNVIMTDSILGKAKKGNQLDGLTFSIGDDYTIIISTTCQQPLSKLLLHELVHVVVDIFCGGNFENDYVAIENQVEQYVAQVWGDNIAML